jgi:hypothetical protein
MLDLTECTHPLIMNLGMGTLEGAPAPSRTIRVSDSVREGRVRMRIIIRKPVNGKTDILFDDRRGLTGMRERRNGVSAEDVVPLIAEMYAKWETSRQAMLEERKRLSF